MNKSVYNFPKIGETDYKRKAVTPLKNQNISVMSRTMQQQDDMSKTMYTDNTDFKRNTWANFDRKASVQHKTDMSYIQGNALNLTPKSQSKTAMTKKRQSQSVMRTYNLSVQETVHFGSKAMKNKEFGIKDYTMKLWHHDIDKPIVYGIH